MKVRATAVGYGGEEGHVLRQPGDVFEMPDGAKGTWFEPVNKAGRPRKDAEQSPLDGDTQLA